MVRQSLVAAAFALTAVTAPTIPSEAATAAPQHRTVVHHVYTYEPAPSPYYSSPYYSSPYYSSSYYYGPYYNPGYVPAYGPVAPITALPGAAVCLAFSLIGGC